MSFAPSVLLEPGTFGQSYVSQKWPLMLSEDSDCGLICLLLLEQRGNKMYCPLVGGGLYSHKIRQIAQSALYCMCLPSRLWSASFCQVSHTKHFHDLSVYSALRILSVKPFFSSHCPLPHAVTFCFMSAP